jgi:hypothetical protein
MSTLAYGAITRKRLAAPADQSTTIKPPGVRTYVDSLAALVPAEVLALHAFIVEIATKTTKVDGEAVTTITDPTTLKAMFWVGIGLSALLYTVGRLMSSGGSWQGWDWARLLIPPAGFVLWTIVQKTTAWDALSPDSLSEGSRALIGATGAIVLGLAAAGLGVKLNKAAAVGP